MLQQKKIMTMMLEEDFFLITVIISYGSCMKIYYMPSL